MLKKLLAFMVMLYAAVAFAAVDVNKATSAELDSVKGIGPAISTRIVEERKNAPFKDWDDFINRVKGVGDKSAAKLSENGLTVNGASFKGAAPAAASTKKEAPAAMAKEEKKAAPAATAAAPAASKDAKATAKEEKAAAKEEKKAKKQADKEAKAEAKAKAKADSAKPAASAASASKK
ncbi:MULTISPECIES: helix-hairpin-helix domain-containing protein [Ramlibacter]|uniref:Helix-hairpin-helix domain-containing protein n=1 Tax=Ramlibacter aquaticus TaxID=2780094 RepID=A0ABR9SF04_9BURK|nr:MULTISPECIES: helix-hairpin-helix domain-containing protein [Ramlibacter]MBE7940850.1 helix-hairpin-helix domain-containing protein [Ramlibacter aquaticus]